MDGWPRNRGSAFDPGFEASLTDIGLDYQRFDRLAPGIDEVLAGVSDAKLDLEFPPRFGNLRLIVTNPTEDLPALRVAFRVDGNDGGKICYVAVDVAEDDDLHALDLDF